MNEPNRRLLAVIVHADVVESTALVQEDETLAHERIRDTFRRLSQTIESFGGTAREIRGDALVADFPRASDAVSAAIAFQGQNALVAPPGQSPPQVRIGISLGEVVVADGTITGAGVVLAQRLEQLSPPGGVVVQGAVAETLPARMPFVVADLGEQTLKGFAKPVRAFSVRLEPGKAVPCADSASDPSPPESPGTERDKPSIAVMRFDNMSGDTDQQYFTDGMVEEIVTGLSRVRWITVVARNSSFALSGAPLGPREIARRLAVRYVLGGSVRRSRERVRITVSLIEAESGDNLWAERFEGTLDDVFELQDRITAGVIGAIEPSVRKAEIERIGRKRPEDLGAYDLYLRALAHMYAVSAEGRAEAMAYAERALAIVPDYAQAHGVIAWCCFARSLWEGELTEAYRDKALSHARAVQTLQSEDSSTLAHAAIALAMASRDFEAALELIARAIAINPSSAHAHGHGAVINTWAGRYETAIALAERALRLSPFEPLAVMPLAATAGARLMLADYEAAIAAARRALQLYPTHAPSHLITVASLVRSGRAQEARAAASRYLEIAPSYRVGKRGFFLPGFDDDLRSAGLPG